MLTKDVRHRLQHIGDARLELEGAEPGANVGPVRRRWPRAAPALLGAAVVVAVTAALAFWLAGRRVTALASASVARLTLTMEGEAAGSLRLPVAGWYTPFAISPDGERLVFRGRGGGKSQLFLRELSGVETRALPGTDAAQSLFFSPDGRWIAFWRAEDRILRKVSLAGGSPIEIAPTDVVHDALWIANDEIVIQNGEPDGATVVDPGQRRPGEGDRRSRSLRRRVDLAAGPGTRHAGPAGRKHECRRDFSRCAVA